MVGFLLLREYKLQFKRLSANFVTQTRGLSEVLTDKGRGYCVTEVKYGSLSFAVPLRTKLNHRKGKAIKIGGAPVAFITDMVIDPSRGTCYRGLDYEKALLISDINTDLSGNYPLPNTDQKTILNDNEYKIGKEFERYVNAYIRAFQQNLPYKNQFFRSTLVNYHKELEIE